MLVIYYGIIVIYALRLFINIIEYAMRSKGILHTLVDALINMASMLAFTLLLTYELHYQLNATLALSIKILWGIAGLAILLSDAMSLHQKYKIEICREHS